MVSAADTRGIESPWQGAGLAPALQILARRHGFTVPLAQILAHSPMVNGELPLEAVSKAAARIGFSARLINRPIERLSPQLLPAIVLLKDGSCAVLLRNETEKVELAIPESGGGSEVLTRETFAMLYAGAAIIAKPERATERAEGSGETQGHWFWSAVEPLKGAYIQVVVAAAFVNLLALASPLFVMNIYDRVLPNKAITTLWVLVIGISTAFLFDFVLRTLRSTLVGSAGRIADVHLAKRVFSHVLRIDLRQRPGRTGEFANQLRDFEFMRDFFTSNTLATLTDMAFFGVFIFAVWMIGGVLALVPLIGAVLVIAIAIALQRPLRRIVEAEQAEGVRRYSLLFESLTGLDTVKALGAETDLERRWDRAVTQNAATTEKLRHISSLASNATVFVQQMVTVGIVLTGAYLFAAGEVSTGAIVASVMLASRAVGPLGSLTGMATRGQQALHAYRNLDRIMSMPEEGSKDRRFTDREITEGSITFNDVSLTYPDGKRKALDRCTLTIKPGERIGIVGRIGSGKSSIGRLLAGLYAPSEGSILIDGLDIGQYHPGEVRRRIAYVAHDAMLFHGTVRENIALGQSHISDERIIAAAEIAGVMEFVRAHPDGLDMPVGENGRALSSGQRQSIILARAFAGDPLVIFLDEPTASVDRQTERAIVSRIRGALRPHQTLIVTTHRTAALDLASRVVVMDQGRIIQDGPKANVLSALASKGASG